jgi:hypothetical protein
MPEFHGWLWVAMGDGEKFTLSIVSPVAESLLSRADHILLFVDDQVIDLPE